jgi:hypothetical protein
MAQLILPKFLSNPALVILLEKKLASAERKMKEKLMSLTPWRASSYSTSLISFEMSLLVSESDCSMILRIACLV